MDIRKIINCENCPDAAQKLYIFYAPACYYRSLGLRQKKLQYEIKISITGLEALNFFAVVNKQSNSNKCMISYYWLAKKGDIFDFFFVWSDPF
jgi:hypothetical protein